MSGRPWYKRDGAAFIRGTMGLTLEEKGAYSLCLDLIYSAGGPIPDDARWLAGVCNVSLRKWSTIRESLIRVGKLFAEGGRLMNERAVSEIKSLEVGQDFAGETAGKSGQNRVENSVKSHETSVNRSDNLAEVEAPSSKIIELEEVNLSRIRERVEEDKDKSRKEKEGSAAPSALAPAVISLPTNKFNAKGEEVPITQAQVDDYSATYPAVDVMQQLREMRRWLLDNSDQRKTAGGMARFVNRWLGREQDKAGRLPANANLFPTAKIHKVV